MTQLDGLTDWFSRLYGAEAGARMAAACMENGLEKTVVEYGHDPTIKERFNRRLDCSPQHWLSANRLMPKNLLENGLPWLAYMEKHPDADKDAAWDLIARDRLEDKRRRGVRNLTGLRRKAPGFSHGDIRRFVFFWCLGVYRLSGFN